jgi:cytochrome c biogenesis protein CcmG/thiol:disulfide interchange protein DsbE
MNRKVLLGGLLVSVPLLVFLALGFRSNPNEIESPLLGKPAPVFQLRDLDNQVVDLRRFAGRPVVLNFWATWCVPCVAEHGTFRMAASRYGERVTFLGVVYQDEAPAIRSFLQRYGSWGPTLLDPEVAVAIAYGVYGVPETFVIDPRGTIARKFTGEVDARELEAVLQSVL